MKTAEERFAEKWREDQNGCHVWTAKKNAEGYGYFWLGGRDRRAHRIAWEWAKGPITEGRQLDHLCRNRACVNVDHLEPVTCRENVLRGVGPAAVNARKVQCVRGHELGAENVSPHSLRRGDRECRTCMNARKRAKRAAGLDTLFGQWPGDETDAQLAAALRGSQ